MRFVIAEPISHPAGDQGTGLVPMHDLDQLPGVFFRNAAGHVKPDQLEIAVVRRDFLYLRQALLVIIIIEGFLVPIPVRLRSARGARISPVKVMGIIKAESDPVFLASLGKFFHRIPAERRRVTDVESIRL